jgi:IK cytokine
MRYASYIAHNTRNSDGVDFKGKVMLSNNDFAQLLKSGDVAGGGGKVRFDLKQVSDWDKQNAAVFKKKKHSGGKTPGRYNNNDDTDEIAMQRNAYRDRALERRKEVNSAEDAALEAVVAKLDAEQTKFLGGDLEHTHLVKGLDYALLRKIRGSATESGGGGGNKEAGVTESSRELQTEATARRDVPVQTLMGHNIKDLLKTLSRSQLAMERSSKASDKAASSSVASMFARLAFDFDVNPETEVDLPTSITRSKQVGFCALLFVLFSVEYFAVCLALLILFFCYCYSIHSTIPLTAECTDAGNRSGLGTMILILR